MTSATGTITADAIQSESADMPRRFSLSDSWWEPIATDKESLGTPVHFNRRIHRGCQTRIRSGAVCGNVESHLSG